MTGWQLGTRRGSCGQFVTSSSYSMRGKTPALTEYHFLSLHRKPGTGLQNHGTSQGSVWTKNFQSEGLFRERRPAWGVGSSSAWYQGLSLEGLADVFLFLLFCCFWIFCDEFKGGDVMH